MAFSLKAFSLRIADDNEEPPEELEGEDLEYVIKLHAASGRCSTLLMDKDKSEASFQANLDVSTKSVFAASKSNLLLT